MFEQDRQTRTNTRGLFREADGAGMTRYQVSGVNDAAEIQAEQEADRVTDSVFRSAPIGGDGIFRSAPIGGDGIFRDGDGVGDAGGEVSLPTADLNGPSESLPMGLQGEMEQSFGTSFAGVRVHNDASADRLSRGVSARAFTRGQDIYFRSGEYAPDTQMGQHLIAHELAHVAAGDEGLHRKKQQTASPAPAADPDEDDKKKFLEVESFYNTNKDLVNKLKDESWGDEAQAKNKVGELSTGEKLDLLKICQNNTQDFSAALEANITKIRILDTNKFPEAVTLTNNLEALESMIGTDNFKANAPLAMIALRDENNSVDKSELQNSEVIKRMLADALCDEFFKAVNTVRTSAKGMTPAVNTEQAAFDAATDDSAGGNKGLKAGADVEITGSAVNRRNTEIASNIMGYVSAGGDVLSGVSEGKDHFNKSDKKAHATASDITSMAVSSVNVINNGIGTAAGATAIGNRQDERKKKLQALGKDEETAKKMSKSDRADKAGLVGEVFGEAADLASIASAATDMKKEDGWSAGLDITSNSLSLVGDIIGMSASGYKRSEHKKEEANARSTLKSLGKQLDKAVPANAPTAPNSSESDRYARIHQFCRELDAPGFNSDSNKEADIAELLSTKDRQQKPFVPSLGSKEGNLLKTMQLVEKGRQNSIGAASDDLKDFFLGGLGALGDLTKLGGSITQAAGGKWGGAITNMVGAGLNLVKTLIESGRLLAGGTQKENMKAERDEKVEASRMAIQLMMGLPKLEKGQLDAAVTDPASVENSGFILEAGEQYASVYNMLQASGVEILDIVYAVEKGNFGGFEKDEATGEQKRVGGKESMQQMYENLEFSNMDTKKKAK